MPRKMGAMERAAAVAYRASEFRTGAEYTTAALEAELLRCGRAGANFDTNHPLRIRWEAARIVLGERKGIVTPPIRESTR